MTAELQRRRAASVKAAKTRKLLMTTRDIGGPDAAHRGSAPVAATPREIIERIRARQAAE